MKIIKSILISIWLLFIISFFILSLIQRKEFEIQDKRMDALIKEISPNANLSAEYYHNIMELKKHPECGKIVDSIYENSNYLKLYDKEYKKMQEKLKNK